MRDECLGLEVVLFANSFPASGGTLVTYAPEKDKPACECIHSIHALSQEEYDA
ncbi:MAG: hypothetical protein WA996_04220 [Candidatus Promineifilaceae bacterium]